MTALSPLAAEIRRPERWSVEPPVDGDVTHRRAGHEVRELGGARQARSLLEDAVHERRASVDATEGAAQDHSDAVSRRSRFLQGVLDGHCGQARREVEPA